ncbi:hypothetical protein HRI_000881600 [Hibiscus trionum]|uniref:Uncharacterized protein n=1 Tax=Hibiscus trionum TaxID=183268 RepID=A0A9W7LPJ7_HIBTR|nr:hypothetical protein HRI_000881600 [Hibiscus trionum]
MVETRSQAAHTENDAPPSSVTDASQTSLPGWKQKTSKLQTDLQRLEGSIGERFQSMQMAMLANLYKLMEIALGKRIDADALLVQHSDVLGTPQSSSPGWEHTSKVGGGTKPSGSLNPVQQEST